MRAFHGMSEHRVREPFLRPSHKITDHGGTMRRSQLILDSASPAKFVISSEMVDTSVSILPDTCHGSIVCKMLEAHAPYCGT